MSRESVFDVFDSELILSKVKDLSAYNSFIQEEITSAV